MLALDRAVAAERGLAIRTVQTSMDKLGMFPAGEFEIVIHPVSTCYLSDVSRVFAEVARVLRPGGSTSVNTNHRSACKRRFARRIVAFD